MQRNVRIRLRRARASAAVEPGAVLRVLVACIPVLLLVFMSSPVVPADAYLSELDAEARKVEAREIDGEAGTSNVQSPAQVPADPANERVGASREAFEALLKKNYLGTFGFYKKLPERSRQEIFAEYRAGAPVSEVRKKIIDRLLQR